MYRVNVCTEDIICLKKTKTNIDRPTLVGVGRSLNLTLTRRSSTPPHLSFLGSVKHSDQNKLYSRNEEENHILLEYARAQPVNRLHSFQGVTNVWIIGHFEIWNSFVPISCTIIWSCLSHYWTLVGFKFFFLINCLPTQLLEDNDISPVLFHVPQCHTKNHLQRIGWRIPQISNSLAWNMAGGGYWLQPYRDWRLVWLCSQSTQELCGVVC